MDGVAALGFLVVIKFATPGLLGTFFSLFRNANQDSSVQWRTHDYSTAKELIAQHLWLGRGIGTWYAPKHEVFDNQYLLTLVDSGVVGLVTLLGIVFAALYAALRVGLLSTTPGVRLPTAATDRDLALSVAASVAVITPDLRDVRLPGLPDRVGHGVPAGRDLRRAAARRQRRGGRRAARPQRHRLTDRRSSPTRLGLAPPPRVHGSAQQRGQG